MKKAMIILLSAALVLMAVSCASNAGQAKSEELSVKGSAGDYAYVIRTCGSDLTFEIEGNPTTGYQWQLMTESDSFTVTSDYTQNAAPEGFVGVGGCFRFDIAFQADGTYKLDFSYLRSWAPDDGPVNLSLNGTGEKGEITGAMVDTVE